jgi:Glycosyl hydrolases family 25
MDSRVFPDISNFTGRFIAHQVAASGVLLVGILATDGDGFVSPTYVDQVNAAHEAGLTVWHYHFCRPEVGPDGLGEMAHFWRTVQPHFRPGDRLVLDVERLPPGGPAVLVHYVAQVDARLHNISGQAAIGYMPDSMFRSCGPRLQIIGGDWWIASWGGRVARLGAGRRMIAQQISDGKDGFEPKRIPGIGACDTSRLQFWARRRLVKQRARRP